ncbi:MAG: hypothetical protein ACI8X5_003263 [Planctomycetota bacterium]|jgi:hypothetical protein
MPDVPMLTAKDKPSIHKVGALVALVTVAVVSLVLFKTKAIGLMGFDSYPLILSARIESWSDFTGTFTEELMDGRYAGHYFRPLTNLSFALDYALWGLNPFGYQLTGALLFGATGLAVAWLSSRLLGGWRSAGVLATTLFFFLHDASFEVIPVPARRPEMLCGLFACLSLASQLGEKSMARRFPVVPALWMLCAAASKETGFVLPVISVLAVFLHSHASSVRERGIQALRAGAVHALLIGVLFAMRWVVLDGMGGPIPLPEGYVGPSSLELSGLLIQRLFSPQNMASTVPFLSSLAVVSVLSVLLCSRKALIVPAAWIAVVGLVYGASRSIEQWYLFLPVIGLALFVGTGVDSVVTAFRKRERRAPVLVAGITALALIAFCFCQVRYSPLIHSYPEWTAATAASDEFFEKLDTRVAKNLPGQPITAPPIPISFPAAQTGPAIRGAAIIDDYSVQAWLELVHPGRKFRVLMKAPLQSPLAADESAVRLVRPYEFTQ